MASVADILLFCCSFQRTRYPTLTARDLTQPHKLAGIIVTICATQHFFLFSFFLPSVLLTHTLTLTLTLFRNKQPAPTNEAPA